MPLASQKKTKDIFLLIHLHLATSLVFRLLFEKIRCCQNKCQADLPVSVLIKKTIAAKWDESLRVTTQVRKYEISLFPFNAGNTFRFSEKAHG